MAKLVIKTLGRLEISLDDTLLPKNLPAKALSLLVYLAVTAAPQSREHLAALLWGEQSESEARVSLRQALATLRRHVGAHLIIETGSIEFDRTQPYWLDVEQLKREAENVERGAIKQDSLHTPRFTLHDVVRGDFLAGLSVKHAPDFELWVLEEREKYRVRAATLLERAAQHALENGDDADALA